MGIIKLRKDRVVTRHIEPAVLELNDWAAKELYPQKKYVMAIAATKRAIAIEPLYADLWCNLGTYLWNLQRFDEAAAALEHAVELNDKNTTTWCNLGLTLGSLQRGDEAIKALERALELEPKNYEASWNLGLLRLSLGDYERGWEGYETRLLRNAGTHYLKFPGQAWQGENLTGKTIFIQAEQGIGDNILFARFLPFVAAKARHVIFCALPVIQSLLWDYRQYVEFMPTEVPMPVTDYYVHLASLPRYLGVTLENLPPDPGLIKSRVDVAQKTMPVQLPNPHGAKDQITKVGICWSGTPSMDRNAERSIPFEMMLELVSNPKLWVHSLQVGPTQDDIERTGAGRFIFDCSGQIVRGLPSTGTAIQQMDLVITACTSIAHLAGALGIPCWVLLCYDPYWLWGRTAINSKWYPSVRLFRQKKAGDWAPVIQEVQRSLVN